MIRHTLWSIVLAFAPLSLLMFGGANAIIPEIHRQAVEVRGWMDDETFATLFAIAQAAPGPNILIVSLIGWQVAGAAGLLTATLAINLPHCVLAYGVGRGLARLGDAPWVRTVKNAFMPVTVGLILASGLVMARAADHGMLMAAISLATAGFIFFTELNPLWMLAAATFVSVLAYHLGLTP